MVDIEQSRAVGDAPQRERIPDRRAALYGRLGALRFQTVILRCQLAKADNEDMRELLAGRLGLIDARAADIHARLIESRAG